MTSAWVTRKSRKTGSSASTDSRTPRMFRVVSTSISATSTGSLAPAHSAGRKLKSASPAAAIEMVMVRT